MDKKMDQVLADLMPKYYTTNNRSIKGSPVQELQREAYLKRKKHLGEFNKVSLANDGINRIGARGEGSFENAREEYLAMAKKHHLKNLKKKAGSNPKSRKNIEKQRLSNL